MINYLLICLITVYSFYIIYKVIHNYKKAGMEGTSLGCYSCSAHKNGTCTNHSCTAEKEVDKMIEQAKKNLNHNK